MQKRYIYNVLIKGVSIGLTFHHSEAMDWCLQSMNQKDAVIVKVRYLGF